MKIINLLNKVKSEKFIYLKAKRLFMEFEELLTKSKWSILKELAKGDKSAVEIAKKAGQSIANISQQLALLEAYNMVKKAKQEPRQDKQKKAGKPKTPYCLNQELLVMSLLKPGLAEKRVVKLRDTDDYHRLLFGSFFMLSSEEHYCLMKFITDSDMVKKAESIGYLSSNEKEIELFIITEHITEVREKYSNVTIPCLDGKTKKIISWSHNRKEVEEGLEKNEEYFINLVKNSIELIDKKDYLKELNANV
jgi:predicted DNA-binding protein YlxM (UPF0122 family)